MSDREKPIKCPECDLKLPEQYFLVMAFLKGDSHYWCPECVHEWKMKKE